MTKHVSTPHSSRIAVPVTALALYAVASGYLMSLIPLMLNEYAIPTHYASWLASTFYAGLLCGALCVEPLVQRMGHRTAFIASLAVFAFTIVTLPAIPNPTVWLMARVIAGRFIGQMQGLLGYLFAALLATSIYMLFAAASSKPQIAIGV